MREHSPLLELKHVAALTKPESMSQRELKHVAALTKPLISSTLAKEHSARVSGSENTFLPVDSQNTLSYLWTHIFSAAVLCRCP